MLENINKLGSVIPSIAILVYLLGYITLASYLQSNGINLDIAFDAKVVKCGFLSMLFIIPICYWVFFDFDPNDLKSLELSLPAIRTVFSGFAYAQITSLSLSVFFFGKNFDIWSCITVITIIIAFIINSFTNNHTETDNQKKIRQEKIEKIVKIIFPFIVFFSMLILLLFKSVTTKGIFHTTQLLVFVSLLSCRIYSKVERMYLLSQIIQIALTLMIAASLIGGFILSNTPFNYGGEQSIENVYYLKRESVDKFFKTSLGKFVVDSLSFKLKKVYETDEKMYFKTSDTSIISIEKSDIDIEQIRRP